MQNPIPAPLILDVVFDIKDQVFQVKGYDELNQVEFVMTTINIAEACDHLKAMMVNTIKASPFFQSE